MASILARTPTIHGNERHSVAFLTTASVEAHTHVPSEVIGTAVIINDARLSDSRTPLVHDNTKHSETYITSLGVTYETLSANADIGTGSTQVSRGDHTHASSGLGYAIYLQSPTQATLTDAQTVYWGNSPLAIGTTADITRVYIPKAGTIKACYIYAYAGTAGTAENWSMYIRKNNTTDTLVQTLALSNQKRVWSNTSLSIAVVAGDYIQIKEVEPTWATNPATVTRTGIIYIE
jgi:hypothetical protein